MHVFVTGAAGFIGRATVKELIAHGHSVTGLARNEKNASIIAAAGATPLKGDLDDLDSLRRGAEASDGVIHLAFIHDFSDYARVCALDRAAIEALGQGLGGSGKPLVIASGTLLCRKGVLATEDSEAERDQPPFSDRALSADLVEKLSKENGIRGSVIRLPPTVHGEGDGGFARMLIDTYHQKGGPIIYVGDGSARWPACHRDDAAVLFRLALEKGKPGSTFHAINDEGVPTKELSELIAKHMKLPVAVQTAEEATAALGLFGSLLTADNPCSSEKTRKELGWQPTRPGIIADFDANFPY